MTWSRESRQARGYGAAWDKLRLQILERDQHLCRCPECLGGEKRVRAANEVNHVISKAEARRRGWTQEQVDDPSNLQAVNSDCHKRITLEQRGARPKQRIQADGWPAKDA